MSETLYETLISEANLKAAARKALRGKRGRHSAARFWFHQEHELAVIRRQLDARDYRFGGYSVYHVHDKGVTRRISAAPFRDRVVHHAIVNVIEPLFEPSFIYDSYANRKGKGTVAALERARRFAHRFDYVLRLDIRKYFPSIDHAILKSQLRRKIDCDDTLGLLDRLIDRSNPQDPVLCYFPGDDLFTPHDRRRGIPLGNLTSQFFGNLYLSGLDHHIKDRLGVKGYLRYVDDLTLFGPSPHGLQQWQEEIETFLRALRLELHPIKHHLAPTAEGFDLMGHRVYPTHYRLTSRAIRRQWSGFNAIRYNYRYAKIDAAQARTSLMGRLGFLLPGSNYRITEMLLARTLLCRPSAEAVPSRRFVEQQSEQLAFGQSQHEHA